MGPESSVTSPAVLLNNWESTPAERAELERFERVVTAAVRAPEAMGAALDEIRRRRLYKARNYATFESYVSSHLKIGARAALYSCGAATVRRHLAEAPDFVNHGSPSERALRPLLPLVDLRLEETTQAEGDRVRRAWEIASDAAAKDPDRDRPEPLARELKAAVDVVLDRKPEAASHESVRSLSQRIGKLVDRALPHFDSAERHALAEDLFALAASVREPDESTETAGGGPRRDGMRIARSAAGKLNEIHGNDSERAEAFAFMRRWLDVQDGASADKVAERLARDYGVTPEEIVENGRLAAAIDALKANDPEIETKFLSDDGPSREEVLEKARTLKETVPPVLTCNRCGATAPLGGRVEHRAPCVEAPRVVEAGQIRGCRRRVAGRQNLYRFVVRVDEDGSVLFRDTKNPNLEQRTTVAKLLETTNLELRPDPKIVALFEKPVVAAPVAPRRRRK